MRGFLRRHPRLFGGLVLAGVVLGFAVTSAWDSTYRARIGVLITGAGGGEGLEITLEREAQFVNAVVVRSAVRAIVPTAPDEIDVERDRDARILWLEAPGDSPDEAVRLVRAWANAFVAQREAALTAALLDRDRILEDELDGLEAQIGEARGRGDDREVERLQARRDVVATDRTRTLTELAAVQDRSSAAVVDDAEASTGRSGVRVSIALLVGGVAGMAAATLLALAFERSERQADEARSWLSGLDPLDAMVGDLSGVETTHPPETDETPSGSKHSDRLERPEIPHRPSRAAPAAPGVSSGSEIPHRLDRVAEQRLAVAPFDDGRIRFVGHRLDEPLRVVAVDTASAEADDDPG